MSGNKSTHGLCLSIQSSQISQSELSIARVQMYHSQKQDTKDSCDTNSGPKTECHKRKSQRNIILKTCVAVWSIMFYI